MFALSFAVSLSVGDAGYWLFAVVNVRAIKNEISEAIQEHCLQRQLCEFTFATGTPANEEIVWTEQGKEFSFHNEMYDVVKSVMTKDSTTYRCFKDAKENDFRSLVSRHANDDDINSPSIRLLDLKIAKEYTEHKVSDRFFSSVERYALPLIPFYQDPTSEHFTPPPKFS